MDFIKQIRKLFAKKEVPKTHPDKQEVIERTASEQDGYRYWADSDECRRMMEYVFLQHQLSDNSSEDAYMYRRLKTSHSNGFMLRFSNTTSQVTFQYMIDYLRDRVKTLGYKTSVSDRKYYYYNNHSETIERHYMKPSIKIAMKRVENRFNQLYGNILIELYYINDIPTHIKFWCNSYNDSRYTDPLPYDELMAKICTASASE